ncbi:MAG TPA: rod shape-determining protein RodA [Gaiellaceae bacterium]|jgi:rod shape determining protein RodA|nr:rod shape-determining protein RodA [Gaiellaceae bacterium]
MIEAVDTRAKGLRTPRREEGLALGEFLRRLDWPLLAATVALLAYCLWAVDGITRHGPGGSELTRQATYAAGGFVVFLAALAIDPDFYRRQKKAIYVGTLGLMVFVLAAGSVSRGSRRWIDLGFFQLQPSEFGKVLFALFLAAFLADRARRIGEPRTVLAAIGLALVPIALVERQPDLGTALVYGAVLVAVLFVAGIRWLHLSVIGLAIAVVATGVLWWMPALGVEVLKPYQRDRLIGFVNPSKDPRGTTYNVNQSLITVGAGGVQGRGVNGATQTNLGLLPESDTDFVFASLAEQRGFVGAAVLLLLYLLVVWRGLKVMAVARDPFCAIAAGGIVFMFVFQVFVNVGMTIGIAPITGIPLPFLSVGGSSMVTNMLAIGILQAIHARSAGPRRPRRSRR